MSTQNSASRTGPICRSLRVFSAMVGLSLLLGAPHAFAGDGWEQISNKDGVTVERRPRAGSSFYELRARAVCPVPPENFAATVWSYRDYPAFVPYLKSLQVLEEGADESTLYQQIGMPLVSDRDYTIRFSRFSADGKIYEVRFESADQLGPPPGSDFVRAQNIEGGWRLEPLEGGKSTQITYELYSEPGGSIPSWIVNLAQKDAPRELVLAMIHRAQEHPAATASSDSSARPKSRQLEFK